MHAIKTILRYKKLNILPLREEPFIKIRLLCTNLCLPPYQEEKAGKEIERLKSLGHHNFCTINLFKLRQARVKCNLSG